MIDVDNMAEPAGWFLSILGSLVMGVSVGLGMASYSLDRRFACGFPHATEGILNITAACGDLLGGWNWMVLATAGGGGLAFLCGLVVMVYGRRA